MEKRSEKMSENELELKEKYKKGSTITIQRIRWLGCDFNGITLIIGGDSIVIEGVDCNKIRKAIMEWVNDLLET